MMLYTNWLFFVLWNKVVNNNLAVVSQYDFPSKITFRCLCKKVQRNPPLTPDLSTENMNTIDDDSANSANVRCMSMVLSKTNESGCHE
jgi:hypothetical protein